jgi:fructokinase
MNTALVIGEALTDIVASAGEDSEYPGGSPYNVAITLGRLGDDVSLLTSVGSDARGAEIRARLDESNVRLEPRSLRKGATSTARAQIGSDGSATYTFDISWELPEWTPSREATVIHAGSIALFLQPGARRVKELLAAGHGSSLVTLDPNIRPALLGSHGEVLAHFESLLGLANLVKLSDEDAAWLYPKLDLDEVLLRMLALGPSVAVATRGASGSVLVSRNARTEIPIIATPVADTIGAGDSYMGALIHSILLGSLGERLRQGETLAGEPLAEAGAFAACVAALTVSQHGANPPWGRELGLLRAPLGDMGSVRSDFSKSVVR